MSRYFLGCNEAEVIFLGCLKISWTDPPYVLVLSVPRGYTSKELILTIFDSLFRDTKEEQAQKERR